MLAMNPGPLFPQTTTLTTRPCLMHYCSVAEVGYFIGFLLSLIAGGEPSMLSIKCFYYLKPPTYVASF